MVVAISIVLAMIGLLLHFVALWRIAPRLDASARYEPLAFVAVPVTWWFCWPYIYVWLIASP